MSRDVAPRMSPPAPRSHLLLGIIIGLLIALVVGAILVAPVALTHRDSGRLEATYGNAVVGLVARLGGRSAGANPVANDARAVQNGRDAYLGACSQCHGPAGKGKGVFGTVTFPPATDLTSDATKAMTDDQLFYIVKNGLGFTPMPAYTSYYSDQEIWSLVSYIRALQKGTAG